MAPAPPVRDLVDLQIRADLEGRRPTPRRSLGAGRQSRSTSVEAPEPAPRCIRSSTAPMGARRDAQRWACDAPRKAASWYAADTNGNIRLASPEGSVRAENHGNSTNNQALRARTRARWGFV